MEEDDEESVVSVDNTADLESQDYTMDDDTHVKVNGVVHEDD